MVSSLSWSWWSLSIIAISSTPTAARRFVCRPLCSSRATGSRAWIRSRPPLAMASSSAADNNGDPRPPKFENQKVVRQEFFDYAMKFGLRESVAVKALRKATASHPEAIMMGDPLESALFGVLLPAMNAKKVVEVGVYTGYTTLVMAESLPPDGKVVGLDITREYFMDEYWPEAERAKLTLQIGPALESLQKLCDDPEELETYDFSFVDADKVSYPLYYELLLKLTRKNGIIAFDNVLWFGKVTDESVQDEDTVALRQLSQQIKNDARVAPVMLPFADGVTLVRKL